MTENILRITFKQETDHRDVARERLGQAEAGVDSEEIEQDVQFILNFEEFEEIARLMRQSNLELIEAIVAERPGSIRQTATAVDRDYREVHRNLQELESLGVVEFKRDGRRKQPVLRAGTDTIDFSIQFPRPTENGELPSASA